MLAAVAVPGWTTMGLLQQRSADVPTLGERSGSFAAVLTPSSDVRESVRTPAPKTGLLKSIRSGIGEVRSRTWLVVWTAHVALINLLIISPIFVLGPFIASKYLGGAPAWAAIGIGYTVGGLAGG